MSGAMRGSLWAALVLLAAGCSGNNDSTCASATPVKLSDLQAAVFTPTCATAACHSGPQPAQGLDLESGQTWAAVVNRRSTLDGSRFLVQPGNAAQSEVYVQVASGLMPQAGMPLSADQQKQLHDWICVGAPDN